MESTISEMKDTLERINSRITEAKERISDVGDKVVEITSTEKINETAKTRTTRGSILKP